MQIIYPPLVEQALSLWKQTPRQTMDAAAMYHYLVQAGILEENGLPTEDALKQGYVKDYYEEPNLPFSKFLEIYPYFRKLNPAYFRCIDGYWEIPTTLQAELKRKLDKGSLSLAEREQVENYLEERI